MNASHPTSDDLTNYSLNESCSDTILLIHGAISSPAEYALVVPHLQDYHLLIPALPSHSPIFTVGYEPKVLSDPTHLHPPFSLPAISALLATLIRTHAHNSRAHIVGLSLGGHLAIYLAAHHPDVCTGTVFASGITLFSQWTPLQMRIVPYIFYLQSAIPARILPQGLYKKWINISLDPAEPSYADEVGKAASQCASMKLCGEIFETLAKDQDVLPVKARTLIVAGTKSTKTKFPDPVEDARFVVERMREGNKESKGMQVRGGSHPWDIQLPELFAGAVRAWVEGREMPDGIEDL